MNDSFGSRATLRVGGRDFRLARLDALEKRGFNVSRLPYSLRILLENLLRSEDGVTVTAADIEALASWDPKAAPTREIAFMPARVLLQDFTGVPAVVDLAAMRDAMRAAGRRPEADQPAAAGRAGHRPLGAGRRVRHRRCLRPQRRRSSSSATASATPSCAGARRRSATSASCRPDTGIVHQVNLEYLAPRRLHRRRRDGSSAVAYPDTLVGTDSHTTMINGLGVLGWGVGGIEAEAAMLGQPVSMLDPAGRRLPAHRQAARGRDRDRPGADRHRRCCARRASSASSSSSTAPASPSCRSPTAPPSPTWRPSTARPAASSRSTPRRSATCASPAAPKSRSRSSRPTARSRASSTPPTRPRPVYTDTLELDLATVEPSLAGPKRPQDRVRLCATSKTSFAQGAGNDDRRRVETAKAAAPRQAPRRAGAHRARTWRRRARAPPAATASRGVDRAPRTARSSSPRSPAAPTRRTRR